MNGDPFEMSSIPMIFNIASSNKVVYDIAYNDIVNIIINLDPKLQDRMAHPIHLHGHKF